MKTGIALIDQIDWRYWAVLVATAVYIGMKNAESEPIKHRLTKVLVNGLLAVGLGRDLAPCVWNSEIAASVILMSAGWIILDVVTGIIANPTLITDIVRARLGLPKDGEDK